MHAAKVLDSPVEYKQALLLYAKKISDEAFKGKAEEVIKELFGPVYWSVGRLPWFYVLFDAKMRGSIGVLEEGTVGRLRFSACRSVIYSRTCFHCLVGPCLLYPSERDMLITVGTVRSKNLAKMGMEWQEMVKRASNDDC
jgi:protein HIRA/HIR1